MRLLVAIGRRALKSPRLMTGCVTHFIDLFGFRALKGPFSGHRLELSRQGKMSIGC